MLTVLLLQTMPLSWVFSKKTVMLASAVTVLPETCLLGVLMAVLMMLELKGRQAWQYLTPLMIVGFAIWTAATWVVAFTIEG